eukprot:g6566.t1
MGNLCCASNLILVDPSSKTELPVEDANRVLDVATEIHSISAELSSLTSIGQGDDSGHGLRPMDQPRAVRRWRKGRLLAQGAFGRVFAGIDLSTGQPIAIKQVQVPSQPTRKDLEQLRECLDEIKTLEALRHTNIVRYLGSEHTRDGVHAFIEYAGFGSIDFVLDHYGPLPETVIRRYVYQIVTAVEFMHRQGYVHRDIKGANLLVMENGVVKLADFGASKMWIGYEQEMHYEDCRPFKSTRGTPCFMAPEILLQERYGRGVDIWAIGCTVIEMATGLPPWAEHQSNNNANANKIIFRIRSAYESPPFPRNLSTEGIHFLTKCFERNPEKRPSAKQLLEHPFLQNCAALMKVEEIGPNRTSVEINNVADNGQIHPSSKPFGDLIKGRQNENIDDSTEPSKSPRNESGEVRDRDISRAFIVRFVRKLLAYIKMVSGWILTGAVFGFTTQMYTNALRKLPLTRYPWEYVFLTAGGAMLGNYMSGAVERAKRRVEEIDKRRTELIEGPPKEFQNQ